MNLPFNWFDVFLLVWLVMGIFRGRKRGMSEELMTVVQWIAIVIVCAFTYQPLGAWLQRSAKLAPLTAYMTAYVGVAVVLWSIFAVLQRTLGGKLIGSDVFGKSEYYLGMPAGMLRFLCMLIVGLSLLNARLYSKAEVAAYHKFQMENYGSEFFPGLQTVQSTVFEQSVVGPPMRKYLGFFLIQPTEPLSAKKFKQQEWLDSMNAQPTTGKRKPKDPNRAVNTARKTTQKKH